jgi:protoporphyrinogen IX oxidase
MSMDMADWILWIKALHVIAVIAWMAGLLYLPRLFVYHVGTIPGSEASEMFKLMERRLLRAIMNPAMIAVFVLGLLLAYAEGPRLMMAGWFHAKLLLVLVLAAMHGMMARWRGAFARDERGRTARFFRIMNEVPTLAMIAIVILAVVKPF